MAAGVELWQINAYTGELLAKTNVPPSDSEAVWGYVAQFSDSIYATRMKPTAPRTAQDTPTRYTFVNNDYNSDRLLVTARAVSEVDGSGVMLWSYEGQGVIAHGSLAVDEKQQRMVLVEGQSAACIDHATDQIPLATIMEKAQLVCLNSETGAIAWEQSLDWPEASNRMYGQLAADKVVLTTSESEDDKANYAMRVWSLKVGTPIWQAKHQHVRNGLFQGEQVRHPVLLSQADGTQLLVAEPYIYDLRNGNRVIPEGAAADWALVRPGHSCGTLSGTGHFRFFRAGNPTLLDLSQPGGQTFTALAPNRAGYWINMIPAAGRLLIPEAIASCICNYSIQRSMAFAPISAADRETALPTLEEVLVTKD